LLLRPFVLPNEPLQLPSASLASRAKNSGHLRELLASTVRLQELRKGVFPDYRFVGELKVPP
jgi:hypothetical protein